MKVVTSECIAGNTVYSVPLAKKLTRIKSGIKEAPATIYAPSKKVDPLHLRLAVTPTTTEYRP